MLALLLLFTAISAYIWMCFAIGRRSVPGAVATFFFALPAVYFLVKWWGHWRHDIRKPFFTSLAAATLITVISAFSPEGGSEVPRQTNTPATFVGVAG